MKRCLLYLLTAVSIVLSSSFARADPPTLQQAETALHKAAAFFSETVSYEGSYVWRYSADLKKREGEGKVGETTAWIQPPGTPYVGECFLDLYELTGDKYYLNAAHDTAMALVRGQLHSGGWDHRIEFAPADRRRYAYRVDGKLTDKKRNLSTLDDNKTQSSLAFLTRYDRMTDFKDATVHEAAIYGLDGLIAAQFPNGAWSHAFEGPHDPDKFPVKKASYRESGEDTHVKAYWRHYTLNDNLMSDVADTLWLACQVYKEDRYWKALKKAGDFLILAQMPEPQPGWAQQYDYDMHPAWARKFEPASITGGESQSVMMTLMDLYEYTGDKKYLQPLPSAIAYYKRSLLPDGRLARFYELKTNKPLYFTLDYVLTYDDSNMPTHYSFKVGSRLDRIEKRYQKLSNEEWKPPNEPNRKIPQHSLEEIQRIIQSMDNRGAWVEDGRLRYWGKDDPANRIIDPRTFVRNTTALAQYIYHLQNDK